MDITKLHRIATLSGSVFELPDSGCVEATDTSP